MDKQYYDDPIREEAYWDDDSYADQEFTDEDDLPKKNQGLGRKSPERRRREEEFQALYNAYMNPSEKLSAFRVQCQEDDLYALLCQLNSGWAHRKTTGYVLAGKPADAEDALSIGCYYAHSKLLEDKAAGRFLDYPIAYYLRLAQNHAIDVYFRKNFGRLPQKKKKDGENSKEQQEKQTEASHHPKTPQFISIDGMDPDDDGIFHNDRNLELSHDPFELFHSHSPNRETCENRMLLTCLEEIMNYSGEPQKVLALMYGKIIFQVVKDFGNNSPLAMQAKKSSKLASPLWAHARMGRDSLQQLGNSSQAVVARFYDRSLRWGPIFTGYMNQTCDVVSGYKWGQIIYTDTYTLSQTSNWIESINKSITQRACRRLVRDPMVMEYVSEDLGAASKIRKSLKKAEKEAVR